MPPLQGRQAAARSGQWQRRLRCRPYKLSSDFNRQPKQPGDLDLWTLKVVSESCVTWATSVPILVFLGLCSWLRPDVRDRQTDVRQHHHLMPCLLGAGHNKELLIKSTHYITTLLMIRVVIFKITLIVRLHYLHCLHMAFCLFQSRVLPVVGEFSCWSRCQHSSLAVQLITCQYAVQLMHYVVDIQILQCIQRRNKIIQKYSHITQHLWKYIQVCV